MPLSEAQQKVADSKARFRVFISGRRVGKTTLCIRELIRYASKPNSVVWMIAPSYRMAKEIVWSKLRGILTDINWIDKANETELTLYLKNGSTIALKGAENYDSLRGRALDFLVMDEVADIKPATFNEVLRPALADRKGHVLFAGTPKGKANWSYDLFQRSGDDWESWQVTTAQGGYVTEEELESARELLDSRTYEQEFEANFITTANKIFYNFDRDTHVKPWNKPIPSVLHIGQDFNYSPMTSVIYALDGDTLHAIDEVNMNSSNTQEMVNEIRSRYPTQKIISYPDPAGQQNKSSAGGKTDISILQNAGFVVKVKRSHDPVRDTINSVNSRLMSTTGTINMFVDPKCKSTIESMDRWSYKEGTVQPDKNDGWDHMSDCVRYITHYLFPVGREFKPRAPARWGHKIG